MYIMTWTKELRKVEYQAAGNQNKVSNHCYSTVDAGSQAAALLKTQQTRLWQHTVSSWCPVSNDPPTATTYCLYMKDTSTLYLTVACTSFCMRVLYKDMILHTASGYGQSFLCKARHIKGLFFAYLQCISVLNTCEHKQQRQRPIPDG